MEKEANCFLTVDNKLNFEATLVLKGAALCLLFLHHLFGDPANYVDWYISIPPPYRRYRQPFHYGIIPRLSQSQL